MLTAMERAAGSKHARPLAAGVRRAVLLLLGAVALLLTPLLLERHRGIVALDQWRQRMRARGEKLTVEELLPSVPTNGNVRMLTPQQAATFLLVPGSSMRVPTPMKLVAPGKARVAWPRSDWSGSGLGSDVWGSLAAQFSRGRPLLAKVCADITNRTFAIRPDLKPGPGSGAGNLARAMRMISQSLTTATLLDLHEGRSEAAYADLMALVALTDLVANDHTLLGHRTRLIIARQATAAAWEALQAPGFTDAQLATLQSAWAGQLFLADLEQALGMERACSAEFYDSGSFGVSQLKAMLGNFSPWGSNNQADAESGFTSQVLQGLNRRTAGVRAFLYLSVWRVAWSARDQLFHHRYYQRAIEMCRRAAVEKDCRASFFVGDQQEFTPALVKDGRIEFPGLERLRYCISAATLTPVAETIDNAAVMDAWREMTVAAIALRRYQLRHQSYPLELEALVPEVLPRVPRDFFSGRPLVYRRNADGAFVLYSVGVNRRDDNGDPRSEDGYPFVPNLFAGRDLVWPQPATEGEARQGDRNP